MIFLFSLSLSLKNTTENITFFWNVKKMTVIIYFIFWGAITNKCTFKSNKLLYYKEPDLFLDIFFFYFYLFKK